MKKTDYLLIYEHKNRELDNLCLLRAELERRGYKVDIFCRFDYLKKIKILLSPKPRVVGCIAAYRTSSLFAQVYRYTGVVKKIINFRWEQVFSESDIENHVPSGDAKQVAHLCWGNLPYQQLKEAGINKISVTGPLQMDFLLPPMNKIYYSQEEIKNQYNIPQQSKLVLYISSFAFATMSQTELEYNEKWYGQSLSSLVESEKKTFNYTIECLMKLLEEDPSLYILYRPHPAEDSSVIKKMIKNERFIINSDYSVKQWILAADHIITWISTAICEVYYAHKNAVILRPYPIHEISDPVVFKNCHYAKDYNDLKNQLYSEKEFPLDENLIKGYYDVDESKPSYVRTADFYEEVLKNDSYNFDNKQTYGFRIFKNAITDLLTYIISNSKILSRLINLWPLSAMKTALNEYKHYSPNIVSDEDIINKVEKYKSIISAY